ncbi:LLM class flavin-dependent oxidoreductase [Streptomyces sp. NPDC091377]|uniref:LLM class flavin-dependent oxidoreductase n=1 Tax=Streptomyces sp. NPDC091377 TaxID=3365995 RepID=UPI0037FDF7C8
MTPPRPLHLAVALDTVGWHPASGVDGDPHGLAHWTRLVQEAERGLLDFVTLEDPPKRPTGPLVGHRLDALLVAAALAARTERIGLVPTGVVDHAQPTHLARAVATLDRLTGGRAGWRTQVTPARPIVLADLFTPEVQRPMAELFERAADLVRVVRALWDGVTDEKELRALAPGRFAPADPDPHGSFTAIEPPGGRAGDWLTVDAPALAPPAPQGHPVVFTLAHISLPYRYGARSADVVSVTPHSAEEARATVEEIRAAQSAAGRAEQTVHVFADLVVFLDSAPGRAAARKARLDEAHGSAYTSDAEVFVGTPADLADLLLAWQRSGISGFRLRPAALPHDLSAVTRLLVPELQRRGAFRTAYEADTLRGLLGLPVRAVPDPL